MNRLMKNPMRRQSLFWGWFLILPTMIGLIVLNIIPLFYTIYQSFNQTGDFGMGNVWVGLDNYRYMFQDSEVLQSIINTVLYMICEVPILNRHCARLSSHAEPEDPWANCLPDDLLPPYGCCTGSDRYGLALALQC